jgi:hypothetical protein
MGLPFRQRIKEAPLSSGFPHEPLLAGTAIT